MLCAQSSAGGGDLADPLGAGTPGRRAPGGGVRRGVSGACLGERNGLVEVRERLRNVALSRQTRGTLARQTRGTFTSDTCPAPRRYQGGVMSYEIESTFTDSSHFIKKEEGAASCFVQREAEGRGGGRDRPACSTGTDVSG